MWDSVGPALIASVFLLPLIIMDCIRWSNRYAGPMVRLHGALTDLASGKHVEPLIFRKGDLWYEMAEQFNGISKRLEQAESRAATAQTSDALEHASENELVHAG